MYVSIMLFQGWELKFAAEPWCWQGHPMHVENNINGLDGDPEKTGRGLAVTTLALSAVAAVQEAYIRKVVDSVNDLDNVLYEICNEATPISTEWQYHLIRFLKDYQATKPLQHPVGMTFQQPYGTNAALFDSPADWISPGFECGVDLYLEDPPAADGSKVILTDTDHLWGLGGSPSWVWKSFCRGLNPIFMDPYARGDYDTPAREALDPQWDPLRESMGHTRRYAERMDLTRSRPAGELTSTGYCLAVPGKEYLVFLPEGGEVSVDLSDCDAAGLFAVEWFEVATGATRSARPVAAGQAVTLTSPFDDAAAVYLRQALEGAITPGMGAPLPRQGQS